MGIRTIHAQEHAAYPAANDKQLGASGLLMLGLICAAVADFKVVSC